MIEKFIIAFSIISEAVTPNGIIWRPSNYILAELEFMSVEDDSVFFFLQHDRVHKCVIKCILYAVFEELNIIHNFYFASYIFDYLIVPPCVDIAGC